MRKIFTPLSLFLIVAAAPVPPMIIESSGSSEFPFFLTEAILERQGRSSSIQSQLSAASVAFQKYKYSISLLLVNQQGIDVLEAFPRNSVLDLIRRVDDKAWNMFDLYLLVYNAANFLDIYSFDSGPSSSITFNGFVDQMTASLAKVKISDDSNIGDVVLTLRFRLSLFALEFLYYSAKVTQKPTLIEQIAKIPWITNPVDNANAKESWNNAGVFMTTPSVQTRNVTVRASPIVPFVPSINSWPLTVFHSFLVSTKPVSSCCHSTDKTRREPKVINISYSSIPLIETHLINRKQHPLPIVPIPTELMVHRPEFAQQAYLLVCHLSYRFDFFTASQISSIQEHRFVSIRRQQMQHLMVDRRKYKSLQIEYEHLYGFARHLRLQTNDRIHERLFKMSLCDRFYNYSRALCHLLSNNLYFGYPNHDCYSGTFIFSI